MPDALRDVAELPDPVGEVIAWLHPAQRPGGASGSGPSGRCRDHLRGTPQRHGRCSGSGAEVRQRSVAARVVVRLRVQHRTGRGHAGRAGDAGLPRDAVQLVPGTTHESAKHLMTARGLVDVLIPRGGAGLIRSVVEESTVPVIETGVGNCHVYVDASADIDKAVSILVNSKTQRTSVCNAAETLLGARRRLRTSFCRAALAALKAEGVTIHGDERMRRVLPTPPGFRSRLPNDDDWADEYYSLDIAGGSRRLVRRRHRPHPPLVHLATPRRSSPKARRRPVRLWPRSIRRPSW